MGHGSVLHWTLAISLLLMQQAPMALAIVGSLHVCGLERDLYMNWNVYNSGDYTDSQITDPYCSAAGYSYTAWAGVRAGDDIDEWTLPVKIVCCCGCED